MVRNDQGDFHCSRRQERTRSQYELGSRVPVIFHIHIVQAAHHPALALAHACHVDREAVVSDAEFLASAKVRCDLRADCFWLLGCACLIGAPLVFFTPKFRSAGPGSAH